MIIDGYEAKVVEDSIFIFKDGSFRGMYAGVTQSNIILRQLIDAIRNADDEDECS